MVTHSYGDHALHARLLDDHVAELAQHIVV
jgi:hypothetical protein